MPVKTLHITNSWHSRSGGVATFYRELLRAAEDARRHMRLVVPAASDGVEDTGAYGRIYYVAARESQVSPGYRLLMPRHYLPPGSPLRRIVEQERPDLVEVCDKYALNYFAGLPRRGWLWGGRYRPAVVGLSCERMDDSMACYLTSRQWARRFCQAYMKWLYFPLFDHHIAVSDYTAAELRQASRGHQVRRGGGCSRWGSRAGCFTLDAAAARPGAGCRPWPGRRRRPACWSTRDGWPRRRTWGCSWTPWRSWRTRRRAATVG